MAYRACKWVTIHGETSRDWIWLGTGHKNNILTTDDSCSFRLRNTRTIRPYISCVILNVRFNIESTTLSQNIAIYVVQIIYTNLGRVCLTGLAFYIDVRCGLKKNYKHLYLRCCLNAHNHNTCNTRLPQTGCTARKMASFIISQYRQTQILAANAIDHWPLVTLYS